MQPRHRDLLLDRRAMQHSNKQIAEIGVGQELRGDGGEIERTNEQLVENKATVFWDNLSNDGVGGELLREDYGSGRGASFQCSNIFSIFAVLVFLFALVDFIMGMDGRRRRRRRDVSGCDTSWLDLEEPPGINLEEPPGVDLEEEGPMEREANLAVALLWRGNLLSHSHHMDNTFFDSRTTYNTYNNTSGKRKRKSNARYGKRMEGWEDPDADGGFWCAATIRCKAAKSAASLGRYGAALAFLTGESPDSCEEDPTCDQVTFPFWQDDRERVKENSAHFRRALDNINNSAPDQQRKNNNNNDTAY